MRVPVGSGFTAELPTTGGPHATVLERWAAAAEQIAGEVGGCGERFEAHRLDSRPYGWLELVGPAQAPPPTAMLTHPRLARGLARRMAQVCDGVAAFYVSGDRVQVCPLALATRREGWHGPFDLRTGFCVAFEF